MEYETVTIPSFLVKEAHALAIGDISKKYHYLAGLYYGSERDVGFTRWLIETYDISWNGEYITNTNMAAYNALPLARQADAASFASLAELPTTMDRDDIDALFRGMASEHPDIFVADQYEDNEEEQSA
jgi:hypothetical protein